MTEPPKENISDSEDEIEHGLANESEKEVVNRCLTAVEKQAKKFKSKGMNTWTFFFGVANSLFVVWSFGAIPEHFWIVYMLETLVLFPIRWVHMANAQPLCETAFWLDFCWFANFCGNLALGVLLIADLTDFVIHDSIRKPIFCCFWGIACGPLLMATGALGNALVFHDADNTVSTFIHLFPSLSLYVARWHRKEVLSHWPGMFHLDYLDTVDLWSDIYLYSVCIYLIWAIPYTLWLVGCAMRLPDRGYDTIFHANMRAGKGKLWSRSVPKEEHARRAAENDYPRSDALIYMTLHMLACFVAMLVSLLCFTYRYVHGGLCVVMGLSTVYNGANKYNYFIMKSYGAMLRKELKLT